ncbi:uroporphyrinogen decarboxylase family protein [Fundidesulfovibrio terrae]|uniref:uroporphyrinogen decarboxylase family protein n=1 Tax=Fundidesulfovibrio terrae TaxID=2922866 RepID=UPI001FAEE116
MNSTQRVFAAVTGEPADRRAFTLTLSLYGAALTGCPLDLYHSVPERYLEGQRAVLDSIGPDILFSPFVLPLEGRAFGCELAPQKNGPPNVKKPAIRDDAGLRALKAVDVESDPGLAYLVESVRLMSREFGPGVPLAGILTAPTDLAAMILGIERWLEILLFEPEAARDVLHVAVSHFHAMGSALLAAGATCIVTPVMFCNPQIMNPELAGTTVMPVLREAFGNAPGPVIFHHGGIPLSRHLDLFKDVPNLLGFVLDERDSFAQARQSLGPDPVLLGGLSGPHMPGRTPEAIRRRVLDVLQDRQDDPRFILATTSADVPMGTPLENILAVRNAVFSDGSPS